MKTALVLSGGGMFGAYQAGAWRALASRFHPDLVVGASVGALNGLAIAALCPPGELIESWRRPEGHQLRRIRITAEDLLARYIPSLEYAVVATDLARMKPVIFRAPGIDWRHLAASCALPGVLPLQKIEGRWYGDGGLLNPLPLWAAVELGAGRIIAVNVLERMPLSILTPFVKGFRAVLGHNPAPESRIEIAILSPKRPLGSMRDALRWKPENIDRWIEEGERDASEKTISFCECSEAQ